MPSFEFTSPEGKKYTVAGPDGATKEQAFQILQAQISGGTAMPDAPVDTKPKGIIDTIASIPSAIAETVSGSKRRTDTTDALPDWAGMPELNSFSVASAKTGLGTLLANPAETVKIIQANFPGVQARQDEKGNFLLKSSMDGKEYAIKPGAQVSDIPRALGGLAAFTPAGRATTLGGAALGAAATQAVIEGTQAATGGEFNPGEVAMAGVAGAAVPAVVNAVRAVAAPAKQLLQRVRGVSPTTAAKPSATVDPLAAAADAEAAGASAASQAPPAMNADEIAQTARKAAEGGMGSKAAIQTLAEQAAPNAKTIAAAKRLGIEDHLQPDHVTTNQVYRELAQAAKSIPGSEGRAAEIEGLDAVAKRASELVDEFGGTHDLSTLDRNLKGRMQSTVDDLSKKADEAYADLRSKVPARAEAPAPEVLSFIEQRAADLDGVKNLSSMEKMIFAKLSPKKVKTSEDVPGNPLMPGQMTGSTRAIESLKQPTYALLDDVRRDLTAARLKKQGPFKDADTGLIKALESRLKTDQRAAIEPHGQVVAFDAAQGLVRVRKGIENDMTSLFGKTLSDSMVGDLKRAVAAVPQGDTSKIVNLLKAVPESMRQEVVASGLSTAFNVSAKNQALSFKNFAQFYEGMIKNRQSAAAIMTNLPPQARKQLSDLYRVSKGISLASKERITTGRIQAISKSFEPVDTLTSRLYETARKSAVGATVGSAVGMVAGPGVGAAVASALVKGAKPEAIKAVDKLITSPEFIDLAKKATTSGASGAKESSVRKFVSSSAWKRYANLTKQPANATAAERWVTQALQGYNQTDNQKR